MSGRESPAAAHAIGAVALVAIGVVGWIDWATGVDIGMSLLYLVPVGWAAWRAPRVWIAAVVTTASASWLTAELLLQPQHQLPVVLWNGFTRVVIYTSLAVMLAAIRAERQELRALNQRLQAALRAQTELASTDPVTGLANARSFAEELRRRAAADGHPICLAYVDLDEFKALNDQYGHLAGDGALREVGQALRASVRDGEGGRPGDLVARLGGDEFAIVFSSMEPETAVAVAERLIQRIRDLGASYPRAGLGASVGIACARMTGADPDDLIRRADEAMYRSKAAGKGRVTVE